MEVPLSPVMQKPTKFRWVILLLISTMYLICYMDRGNLGVALPEIAAEFDLDKQTTGIFLAVFTWAYAIALIPVSWLGDHYGPRRVLLWIMSVTSFATMMTGAALGKISLFGSRLLLGFGEAGAFPVATRGMLHWFAKSERGRIQGITHLFSRCAVTITPFFMGSALMTFGWRPAFYIFGFVGVVWIIVFGLVFRDSPEEHPKVNRAELAQIRAALPNGLPNVAPVKSAPVPWRTILTSRNMWYISLAYACFFFGTNFYLTWYPTYLREHRHLSLDMFGLLGSIPLIAGMLGDVLGGVLSDLLLARTHNAKLARRAVAAPGFALAVVFLIPAALTHDTWTSVLCLAGSLFFLEWVIGPAWAVPMDVGGQFSGTVCGVMNMVGALAASQTAVIYGTLFHWEMWVAPFIVSACVLLLGAVIWTFFIDPTKSVVDVGGTDKRG